jgi:hypothetical protein
MNTYGPASPNRRPKRSPASPGRIDLIPQDFENLIEDQGCFVRITPSILCPNRTELTDTNHELDCPLCGGDEALDIHSKCVKDWAFIQSIKLNKEFNVQGLFDMKDAMITFRSARRVHYWYKIEMLDFSSAFNELIKRGSGDSDKTRYLPQKSCDVEWIVIDSEGVEYEKEIHFRVDDQAIRWITASRPAPSTLYSVIYPILPTFRVLETVHDSRYYYDAFKREDKVPVNMPQQAIIRWDYLARQEGANELRK